MDDKSSVSNRGKLFSCNHYVETYLTEMQTFELKIKFADVQKHKMPTSIKLYPVHRRNSIELLLMTAIAVTA